ncbi:proteasome subunit alpha type-1, partial [Lampetra fluviatilis]
MSCVSSCVRVCLCRLQFRNQYDNDVTVWSPQGRIHQIEYAMEAVKQGSATVGLKSKTHAVIVALKRAQSELAAHQKKILNVDNHVGISIAGLTADARLLCNFMRQECLNSRFVYDTALPISRLVTLIGNKTQVPTQRYGRRPYGVGLLIAGYDVRLAHSRGAPHSHSGGPPTLTQGGPPLSLRGAPHSRSGGPPTL